MLPSDASFRANVAERLVEAGKRAASRRSAVFFALLVAAAIHTGVLFPLFFEYSAAPQPTTQEIPVEILAEPPPKPKPPPPPEQPQPPARPRSLDEEPATDAPRQATKEKIDRRAPDETSKAVNPPEHAEQPKSPEPPKDAGQAQPAAPKAAEKQPEPIPDKPDAEIIRQAAIESAPANQPASEEAKAPSPRTPSFLDEPSPWSSRQSFTAPEALEDVEAVSAAERTPISGKAKSTYLSRIYATVMSHMHMPPGILANAYKIEGVIVFGVDGAGNLTRRSVTRSSGSQELDAAALAAVEQSSPFPAPPGGAPIGMTFTYGAK
jgi:protein TonB